MRRLNSKLKTKFISEKGKDSIDKTYVAYTPLDQFMCIAVAESYDNDTDINSAKLAVETVLTAFEKNPSIKKIKEYIKCANQQILLHSTKNKLKVSITVIVSDYTRMRYGVCGNTKIHVLYENMFSLISNTQTKYEQLIEEQEDGRSDNSQIHNLTQYLGMRTQVKPFISKKIELKENSTILISTSNLWGIVSDVELLDGYENTKSNDEFLYNAQELLLSSQTIEGIGSYTAAAIFIEKTYKEDTIKIKKRKKLLIILAIILLCIFIIGTISICVMRSSDRNKLTKIGELEQKAIQYITYENYIRSLEKYEEASKLTDDLSLNNWQYIEKKKEVIERVNNQLTLLSTISDGDMYIKEKNYTEAKKSYIQVIEQAKYNGETSIYDFGKEQLEEINKQLEINQYIALGDMHESTNDHKNALIEYKKAIKVLKQTSNVELRGEVQLKIYDITQKQMEAKEAKAQIKEKLKQKKENKKIIQIQVILSGANKALGENKIDIAEDKYEEILSIYNQIESASEDTEKIYKEIVVLEQAIAEAKVKEKETATNGKLQDAQVYTMDGAQAAREHKEEKAIKLYNKALAIYKDLKIWNDQVEKIYDEIEILEKVIKGDKPSVKSTTDEEVKESKAE